MNQVRNVGSAGVLLAFILLAAGCNQNNSPCSGGTGPKAGQSARETATWNYWQSMRTIGQKGKHIERQVASAKTPEQISSLLRQCAATIEQMTRDINSLPVLNVDQEVTTYASQSVEVMNQGASIFTEFANFIDEAKAFVDNSNSFGAGLEAFFRGFLGDPLGAYNDAKAQGSQLEQRRQSLLKRWQALEERMHKVDAQQISIRSTLSQRYNREFPKLDD